MKRFFSAAIAAAALLTVTGCEGGEEQPTQVSTSDPSAGITSNYTSQSLQADIVTSSTEEIVVETVVIETITAEPETETVVSTVVSSAPAETAVTSVSSSKPVAATTQKQSSSSNNGNGGNGNNGNGGGGGQAAETTSSSSLAVSPVQTTTTSATTSTVPETTTRPVPTQDEIIEAYIKEVEKKIDSMLEKGDEYFTVSYTLYDMDSNGIPELIVKWGTDEETYQDTFYTYDEFGTKVISDGNPGGYTEFACVPDEHRYVTAYAHMCQGEFDWLDYDGSAITPTVEQFEYSSSEMYDEQMANYGIVLLPYAKYTYFGDESTRIYTFVDNVKEETEIAGRDFSFIYDYEF